MCDERFYCHYTVKSISERILKIDCRVMSLGLPFLEQSVQTRPGQGR